MELRFEPIQLGSTEKAMATHSSTLAWKIPWTEETGKLQSMGSQRVGQAATNPTNQSLFLPLCLSCPFALAFFLQCYA